MSDSFVKYVFTTKYFMFVLYLLSLVTAVNCLAEPNNEKLVVMQLKALDHLKSLLADVHTKIRNSRNVLQAIDLNKVFGTSTKPPPETTMLRPPVSPPVSPPVKNGQKRDTQIAIQFSSTPKVARSPSKPSTLQTTASASWDRITSVTTDIWIKGFKEHLRQDAKEIAVSGENTTLGPLEELGIEFLNNASSPGDALVGNVVDVTELTPDPSVEVFVQQAFVEHKGYLSFGLERLCEAIALKDDKNIPAIFSKAEYIIPELAEHRRLVWLGNPMLYVLQHVLLTCNEATTDVLKSYAQVLGYTMAHRRQTLSDEVNYLIDYADSLVLKNEGEHIYKLINEFALYPNSTLTGYAICLGLIEAFEMPFRKIGDSSDRAFLVKAGNDAFHSRYPKLPTDWMVPYRKSLSFRRYDRNLRRSKRKELKHRLKYHRIRNISNNSPKGNNNNYLNSFYNLSRNSKPNNDNIATRRSFYLEEDKKEMKNVKEGTDKEALVERRTATYKHVVSNEIITRKLIENEFKNIKSTPKYNYDIVYETMTRKMIYDNDATVNKNRNTKRNDKNNKRTDFTDKSLKIIQSIKTTQSKRHKRTTTDYKKAYRSPINRFQLFKRQTNVIKRFQTVHSRMIHANRRSDKILNNYVKRHENIASDKILKDDGKITSNLNNIGYLQMAHKIKLIDQLIHYIN